MVWVGLTTTSRYLHSHYSHTEEVHVYLVGPICSMLGENMEHEYTETEIIVLLL